MSYIYEHPRPAVTVDSIILKYSTQKIQILLIKRNSDPFKDSWALPGGFLDMDEAPEDGVKRELKEETGLEINDVMQIGAFGKPDRDPRGRVISISFLGLIKEGFYNIKAATDASEVSWYNIHELPAILAFDHKEIIDETIKTLRHKLKMSMIDQIPFFEISSDEIKDLNILLTEK